MSLYVQDIWLDLAVLFFIAVLVTLFDACHVSFFIVKQPMSKYATHMREFNFAGGQNFQG